MAQSIIKLQTALMRNYYKNFSKYSKQPTGERKVAWVTAFTPVEILEALGIEYYYPESYAAVIAASGKEQDLLRAGEKNRLCGDCCSYACCIEGCLECGEGPRGVPPRPDVLIATNNQCNTLPNWWNILAFRFQVPLIVLDYPGESADRESAYRYVYAQHMHLIGEMERLSGNTLDRDYLAELISNSRKSVQEWNKLIGLLPEKNIDPTALFDDINYLITARCKKETSELYSMMAEESLSCRDPASDDIPIFWLGYPLWYHKDRYLSELLQGFRIAGSNYITWWSLDYRGDNVFEQLFHAYNETFLNLSQKTKTQRLTALIRASHARGAIVLHNKSCKCDFVSAKEIGLPQVELEVDMIDRTFLDPEQAKRKIDLLKEMLCTG